MAEDLLPLLGVNIDNGDRSSDSESDNDVGSDSEREQVPEPEMLRRTRRTFDPSLPGTHSYLGDDLDDLQGRTVHQDDSCQELPLVTLPGVVLIPGQTLPLHIFQPQFVSMIRNVIEADKTFGLVTTSYEDGRDTPSLSNIGTTVEIFSIKEETDSSVGITTIRVKACGRQRFTILDVRRQIDGVMMAKVRILPERDLDDCLRSVQPQTHKRACVMNHDRVEARTNPTHGVIKRRSDASSAQTNRPRLNRFSSAHMTWWPPWVYKIYDARLVMAKVKSEILSWNDSISEEHMPTEPSAFSFWVAGNLPLEDGLKLHLLKLDNAVQRLRCELSIMERCAVLCCKECSQQITNKNDIFSMAVEGPMAAYVNPNGHVHETFTVHKTQGLRLYGEPSTEASWFPGYAWTIANCRQCMSHMGWKFTSTKRKLKPEKFWGLCRSALLPGLNSDDTDVESWQPSV